MVELTEIESKYFDFTKGRLSPREFEEWVYKSETLQIELDKNEYLALISLHFDTPSVKYEVEKILKNKVNKGKFQQIILLNLLDSIIDRDGKEGESLVRMYDLYCGGYYFLQDLGLGIGLQVASPFRYDYDCYHELTTEQKRQVVDRVYPEADELAQEIKNWIVRGELVLTGTVEREMNRWEYIDNRKEKDKQSRVWRTVKEADEDKISVKRNVLLDKSGEVKSEKKWWQKLFRK